MEDPDFTDCVTREWLEHPTLADVQQFMFGKNDSTMLIVRFDAPSATYLYIDKKMQDHGLFQAICRVNRLDGGAGDDTLDVVARLVGPEPSFARARLGVSCYSLVAGWVHHPRLVAPSFVLAATSRAILCALFGV